MVGAAMKDERLKKGRPPSMSAARPCPCSVVQRLRVEVKDGRPPPARGGSPYPLWSAKQFERRIKFTERRKMGRPPKERAATHYFLPTAQSLKAMAKVRATASDAGGLPHSLWSVKQFELQTKFRGGEEWGVRLLSGRRPHFSSITAQRLGRR